MSVSKSGTVLTSISAVLSFLATILNAIAFGTDFWTVSDGRDRPFVRIGFHHACFNKCTTPYCPAGDGFVFNGCAWIHAEYFMEIKNWLLQDWYMEVRNLAIVVVPLTGVTLIIAFFAAAIVGCWRYPHNKPRSRDVLLQVLLFTSALFQFVTAVMIMVVLALWYAHCFNRNWMPIPDKNLLGFSYWLEMCAAALFGMAFVSSLSAGLFKALRMRKGPKDPQLAEDMMLGRTI